jgi:hypothetical protein
MIFAALTAITVACDDSRDELRLPPDAPPLPVIELRHDRGTLRVEVAVGAQQRAVGLSNRASLPADAGMLFVFERPNIPGFWMKDTLIPLDMIWIDEDKRIAEIDADVQPEPGVPDAELTFQRPTVPVSYALELNAGAAERLDLVPGSQLSFELPSQ